MPFREGDGPDVAEQSVNIQKRADEIHDARTAAYNEKGTISKAIEWAKGNGQNAIDGEHKMRSGIATELAERHMEEIQDLAIEEQRRRIKEEPEVSEEA